MMALESPRTPKIRRIDEFNLFHKFNTSPSASSQFNIYKNTSGKSALLRLFFYLLFQKSPLNNFTPGEGKTNFSASFLSKPEHPKKPLLKRTLCKSYSDGIFHNAASSIQQQDKDSQLIGVTNEHPIGPLCVIRRNVTSPNYYCLVYLPRISGAV